MAALIPLGTRLLARVLGSYSVRSALGLAALLAAGPAGTFLLLPLSQGAYFTFGSVAALMAVRLFGIGWGMAAGMLSGAATYLLWGHAFHCVTFAAEALFVGILLRRRTDGNLVLVDGLYWPLIGAPWLWLLYSTILGLDATTARFNILMLTVGGILNARLAGIILTYLPVRRWVGRPESNETVPLHQAQFNLLLAGVLVAALLVTALGARGTVAEIESTLDTHAQAVAARTAGGLQTWRREHGQAVAEFARAAASADPATADGLRETAALLQRLFPALIRLSVAPAEAGRPPHQAPDPGGAAAPAPTFTSAEPVWRDGQVQGYAVGVLDLRRLGQVLRANVGGDWFGVTVIDEDGRSVASTWASPSPPLADSRRRAGEVHPHDGQAYHWLPRTGSPQQRWQNSYHVRELPVADTPWTLVADFPIAPLVARLYRELSQSLAMVLGLCVLTLVFSGPLSRWLAHPLARLAEVARAVPRQLLVPAPTSWPRSSIREINALVNNFQSMTGAVAEHVRAVQRQADRRCTLLAAALEAADTPITIMGADERFVYANRQFYQAYGYAPEEIIGQTPHLLLGPGRDPDRSRRVHQALDAGYAITLDTINYRKDGTAVEIELILSPLRDETGSASHWVGVRRDISQRKAIDRMKNEFITTVSHELRTPLTAIHGALGILTARSAANLDPPARKLLRIAANNAQRLVRLVTEILDLERIAAGRLKRPLQVCRVDVLAQQALAVVRPLAEESGIGLQIAAEGLDARADPDKVVQVLVNLLSNAVKFSASGSTVTVRAEPQGDDVLLSVRDEGRGIPRECQQQIFAPFYQVDASDSRQKGGTGLGLAIARAAVQEMGGRIWVESEVGRGSCFCFTLGAAP